MAWTYDPALSSDRDVVRLMTGDTLDSDPQLSDEEIDGLLTAYGSVKSTAIAVLRILAARYARYADKWVGDLKILASQKHKNYLTMAASLAASGASSVGAPTAGGIYADEKQAQEENESLTAPTFRRGLMDNDTD